MGCLRQENRRFLCINCKLLPIKAHYFLMYGVAASVSPFLPLIGKSIGLDTTAIGIAYTVLQIAIFFLKPLFGFLADYIRNTKLLVICLVTTKVVSTVCVLLLNPIEDANYNIYLTHQFWIYMLLKVTSISSLAIACYLTDVSCCEILGEQREYYGQQRLYGTASYGIIALLSGYFNDIISKKYGETTYLAGFYVMIALYFLSMIVLLKIDLPKANISTSIISDVKHVCKSMEFITFCVLAFVMGNLISLRSHYLYLYITDLGGNQTLLGSITAVQCLLSEVPFFFFSGWFIKHLGYFNCLTCSFVGFSIRFGMYFFLKNPWLVLPIELLHGVTYAVFAASCTAFASAHSPPGTEACVLGIVYGIYQGLGYASGSFLGGLNYQELGGKETFLIASFLSVLCAPASFISHFIFKTKKYEKVLTLDNETDDY